MLQQTAVGLLKGHELFELLPTHGKVVTLDADLPMKHALDALSSHSATCLPVWDSFQQRFVDVFTCTDLVDIVLFTHQALAAAANASGGNAMAAEERSAPARGDAQQAIERCQLRDLHGLSRSKHSGFVMASVDDSMYHGCVMLKQHGLECLPLGDTSSSTALLHVLLPEQVLAFIAASPAFRDEAPQLFAANLTQTALPHCSAPTTVLQGTSLADSLQLLSELRLHALPVVDQNGVLRDVLSSRDVRHLAATSQTDDLSTRVEDCLRSLPPTPVRLHTCSPNDTLAATIQRLANVEVAQLVCTDERGAVVGVVSAAEILTCLLAQPPIATAQAQ